MKFVPSLFVAAITALPLLAFAQSGTPSSSKSTAHKAVAKPAAPALPPVALPSEPGIYAVFYTSKGNIVCRLFDQDAPKTVANFKGLATGTKPWKDPKTGKTMHTALYSGTIFHRVIPKFMIQGGDPIGTGTGDPGYKFEDEFNGPHQFDKPGILAMANSGPNTNGSQFFITVVPTPYLNGKHTIFGEVVTGQDVADSISEVPTNPENRPDTPVKLIRISIRTVKAPGAAPAKPAAAKTSE